jgi:hypothetical protein
MRKRFGSLTITGLHALVTYAFEGIRETDLKQRRAHEDFSKRRRTGREVRGRLACRRVAETWGLDTLEDNKIQIQ